MREGDTLLVTKLDRLGALDGKSLRYRDHAGSEGVAFKILDDAAVDTTSLTGKLVMGILALIAEFETAIRRERQMESIARRKPSRGQADAQRWSRKRSPGIFMCAGPLVKLGPKLPAKCSNIYRNVLPFALPKESVPPYVPLLRHHCAGPAGLPSPWQI